MYNPAQLCIGVHSPAGTHRTSQERAKACGAHAHTTHRGKNPYTGTHSHVWKRTVSHGQVQQSGVCTDFHGHTPDCRSIHNPIHTSWARTPNVHAQPRWNMHIAVRAPTTQDQNTQHQTGTHNPTYTCTILDRHSQPRRGMYNPRTEHTTLDRHAQP